MIPFNKPYLSGKEIEYISQALYSGKISGDGIFTKKCQNFFEKKYGFKKCMLTASCTGALEMAAILIDVKEGDEVLIPSYTFVSTANPFILRGAKIVFVDSREDSPGMDESNIKSLITERTKAIVVVHYAGVACNMDEISRIAEKYNLYVIEDAALSIDSYYKNRPLGSIGHLAAFSFHETKNIISGEGGMLVINDDRFIKRAEIIREKGTNRSAFSRGEIDKYGWEDIGSSFLPSDIIAAMLLAQLESMDSIQKKRKEIWQIYHDALTPLEVKGVLALPAIPSYATNNAGMFYFLCKKSGERDKLLFHLKQQNIHAAFHYQSLHKSGFYINKHYNRVLQNSDRYANTLVRLPFYHDLNRNDIEHIVKSITEFYN